MTFSVKISKQASDDLHGIFEYIAFDLQSIENAITQLARLEEKLETFPNRFKLYEREPWKSRGLRIMPVNNYPVFYIPNQVKKTVDVVRVMYVGRDIDTQLSAHTKTEMP